MSLTPGYILTDADDDAIGLTLADIATIVAEWDAASDAAHERLSRPNLVMGQLLAFWEWRGEAPKTLVLLRAPSQHYVFLTAPDVAEMRAVLAAQGAA